MRGGICTRRQRDDRKEPALAAKHSFPGNGVPKPASLGTRTKDALKRGACRGSVRGMKVISIDDAQTQLDAVCDRALAGEVIRLRNRAGALVELTPVGLEAPVRLDAQQLAECYEDGEWAAFENHCAKASD